MAGDLGREGRDSGGAAGQAGTPAGPGVLLLIREGVPAGLGEDFIVFRLFWD